MPADGKAEGTGAALLATGLVLSGAGWMLKRRDQSPS